MIFGLDQPGTNEAHFAPLQQLPSSFGERVDASRTATTVATNSMDAVRQRAQKQLWEEMANVLGPSAFSQTTTPNVWGTRDPWQDYRNGLVDAEAFGPDLLAAAATQFEGVPGAFAPDFPTTPEAFEQEVTRRMSNDYNDAQDVLANAPEGSWGAEVTGALVSGVVDDPLTLMLLPFGAGAGGVGRVMATEAALGVAGEALTLPQQFAQADRLGIQDPNVALQLGIAGATSGVLGGAIAAAPGALRFGRDVTMTALDRVQTYRGVNQTPDPASVPDGVSTIEHEKLTAASLQAMYTRPDGSPLGDADFPVRDPARAEGYQGVTIEYAMGGNRPNRPNQPVLDVISRAVEDVLGPGATVRVTSGQEGPSRPMFGSNRHSTGNAADIVIMRSDGTPILAGDPEMAEIARAAARQGALGIGFGTDYMGGRAMHIDLVPPGNGQAHTWGNLGTEMRDEIVGLINGREVRPVQFADFDFSATGNASPTTNRVGYVLGRLLEQGVDEQTAIALVGNFMVEAGPALPPGIVGDSGNAFGIAQLNGPRRVAYLAFARSRGVDPADLDTQVAYIVQELRTTERAAWDAIRNAPDIATAASLASSRYFRPGIPHISRRTGYANELWRQYQNGTVPRWTGATPSAADEVPDFATTSRGFTRDGQVRYGTDQRIDVEYQVVDLALLRQAEGGLQPRDRSHVRSDLWVADTARDLDPALLMPSPTADRGAPIVGPDDMIESGNGRVRAIARAYDRFPDRALAYRSEIERQGYTIPPGVDQPVLIARRRTAFNDSERQGFVVSAQDSGVAIMSAAERARVGRRALTADTIGLFNPAEKLTSPANRDFARRFTAAYPPSQQGQFIGEDKGLSSDGVRQIRDALFARAYDADDILRRYIEEDPGELKTLLDALAIAAPDMALLRAQIDAGQVAPDMDITPFIVDAARLIMAARDLASREGRKASTFLEEMLTEIDLIEGAIAPLTAALVRKFMPGGRQASADTIGSFLSRYAREAMQTGRTGGMFDEAQGPLDVLRGIDPDTFGTVTDTGLPRGQTTRATPAQIDDTVIDAYDEGATAPAVREIDDAMFNDLFDDAPAQTSEVPDPASTIDAMTADGPRQLVDVTQMDPATNRALIRDLKDAQPADALEPLMAMAARNHETLNDAAQSAAQSLGLPFKRAPLKEAARVVEKVTTNYDGDFRRIADVARTGVSVRTVEEADAFIAALNQRFHLIDEGWTVTPAGYFDRKVMVRFDDGQLGELQIWPPGMIEAKKAGGGHDLYKLSRDDKQSADVRAKADADMRALYGAVRDQLDAAWDAKLGRGAPNSASTMSSSSGAMTGDRSSPKIASPVARDGADQRPFLSFQTEPMPSDVAASIQPSNRYNVMGDTSGQTIGLDNRDVNQTATAARQLRDDVAGIEFYLPDGTRITAAELIDDLDRDDILSTVIDACAMRGAA